MSIAAESVAAGAFFKTPDNRIRAVLEVKDGRVRYAEGDADFRNRNFSHQKWQALKAFIGDVDVEVEETWDPNYLHPKGRTGGIPDDAES